MMYYTAWKKMDFSTSQDSLHLFCAQYTFLPRLKADLAKFSAGWNDHPIRTERSLSPNQLWELGMLQCPIREPDMSEENVAGIQMQELDWESSGPSHHADPGVTVPQMECPLKAEDIESLCAFIQFWKRHLFNHTLTCYAPTSPLPTVIAWLIRW
ncbi:hypothetical protein XENORESO_015059 [Xenotaenia resolanae]|uniref:Integrase core domain-containing protein n=1 Tax=Xenotaenia resolanae TaxID=208358 RepID=A0ABV0VSG8_9TELE